MAKPSRDVVGVQEDVANDVVDVVGGGRCLVEIL